MANIDVMPAKTSSARADEGQRPLSWYFNLPLLVSGFLIITAITLGARTYQQYFGWWYGLDSTAPEFQTYWMTLLYAELVVIPLVGVVMAAYIWLTHDHDLSNLAPETELKRYITFITLLFIYAWTFYWAASFFGEQDASWHQVVVRDTSFTASHIIVFYLMFPLFIIQGIAIMLYTSTRLPLYAKGVSIPLLLAVVGPFMVFPNVGLNEWGHAFWVMEEVFTLPLHYGFVFFGWAILALGGILVQLMARMSVLFAQIFGAEAGKSGA